MELIDIINRLKEVAYSLSAKSLTLKWYLFGSILDVKTLSNDIDVLIIYKYEDDPKKVKLELHELMHLLPLDLIFMTSSEEEELQFLTDQKSLMIFPT